MTSPPKASTARLEPESLSLIGWDPARIRTAEALASGGDFTLAADLCEAMIPDARFQSALGRLASATSLPLAFELPGLDAEASENDPLVQALQRDWFRVATEAVLREVVQWIRVMHVALIHVEEWIEDPETGRALPVLKVWKPALIWDDGWQVVTRRGAQDKGSLERIEPGDGRWIIATYGTGPRSIMKAPWRGLSRWWLLKQLAAIDWGQSSERHGQGITVVQNEHPDVVKITQQTRDALSADIKTCGRNGVIVLPDGMTMKVVTDAADCFETFEHQTSIADQQISIGLIGTNLTTSVDGQGSRAAADVHADVDNDTLRGVLAWVSTTFRDQLIVWWAEFNFGDRRRAPYPKWDTDPSEDKASKADTQLKAAQALKEVLASGIPVQGDEWAAEWGFPVDGEVGTLTKPEPPPAPPGFAPGQRPPPPAPPAPPEGRYRLQSGALAPGTVDGQIYVDRVVRSLADAAQPGIDLVLDDVLEIVRTATDPADAYTRLFEAYAGMNPEALGEMIRAAMTLCALAGVAAVKADAAP